jgi:hypothetical protein
MRWRLLHESWNPNKYATLRELSLLRFLGFFVVAVVLAVASFLVLLVPTILQTEHAFERLRETTDANLTLSMTQTAPVYLLQNPDVLVTTGSEEGFITITDEGFSVKYFLFFAQRTYPWLPFLSLDTFPARQALFSLFVFALPSALVWGVMLIALNALVFGVLYTFIAYFVLHVRGFSVRYAELWKVTLFASVPGMTVFAATPILRLGLPVAVIVGLVFVVWLVFSMLGTALIVHEKPARYSTR